MLRFQEKSIVKIALTGGLVKPGSGNGGLKQGFSGTGSKYMVQLISEIPL